MESKNDLEQELAGRTKDLEDARKELAETRTRMEENEQQHNKLKDSLEEVISDRVRLQMSVVQLGRSLDESRQRIEQLEAEVRNYAVDLAKPKAVSPSGSRPSDSPVPEHPLALHAGSEPDRLHVRLDSGRLLPFHVVHGDDFLSTECRSVSKLFLRHQLALQDIVHHYSPEAGRMNIDQYKQFASVRISCHSASIFSVVIPNPRQPFSHPLPFLLDKCPVAVARILFG